MFVMPSCYNAGDVIPFAFDTYDSNEASVTISGLAVTDIEIYKDGSTTQRASDNGYVLLDTDGIDFDGSTGLHGFSIDTGDNSDSGFWADGHTYWVHVNAITVDGQTVRFTYHLALGYTLRPVTAGRKLVVDAAGLADANTVKLGPSGSGTAQTARDVGASVLLSSGTGTGQVKLSGGYVAPNWGDVGNPTTAVDLSGTTIDGLNGDVGGNVAGQVGGVGTNGITSSSFATGAITAAKFAANAIDAAALAADAVAEIQSGLSTLDAAGIRSAVGLASANLDTQLGAIDDYIDTEVAALATSISTLQGKLKRYVQLLARKDAAIATDAATELGEINEDAGSGAGSFDNATDSEQAIRDRGDAAWGSAGANSQQLVDTTVATVNDQTHFELTAAVGGNDTYNNMTVVFYDASASNAPSIRKITDFIDTDNEIVIDSAPDFTVVAGDAVKIFVTPPGTTAPTAAENAAELLNTVNTSSNDKTKVGGQIRRTHARVGGTKQKQDRSVANAPVVSMNEADSAALVTQTPTVAGTETTWTPS